MHLVYGLTTYNRLPYLCQNIDTWQATRNKNHKWTLIICDDGSEDGTKEFISGLEFDGVDIVRFFNKRRGVHYQINKILRHCSTMNFDFGFRAEDDFKFLKSGWDDLYVKAYRHSGYHHLVFTDPEWRKKICGRHEGRKPPLLKPGKFIQSRVVHGSVVMGIFWTFTPKVIKEVGYIDVKNFGLCGHGHIDYSSRCYRAGFNVMKFGYDAIKSEEYIHMFFEDYKSPRSTVIGKIPNRYKAAIFGLPPNHKKGKIIGNNKRKYIPYREFGFNMLGERV